jgi:hypothetical protein
MSRAADVPADHLPADAAAVEALADLRLCVTCMVAGLVR